jgi:hypothetical protein
LSLRRKLALPGSNFKGIALLLCYRLLTVLVAPCTSLWKIPSKSGLPKVCSLRSLGIGQKMEGRGSMQGMKPALGADDMIRFLYEATQRSIVCACCKCAMSSCSRGEQVNFHLEDTPQNREPAVTGSVKKCLEQTAAAESTRKGIQEKRAVGM